MQIIAKILTRQVEARNYHCLSGGTDTKSCIIYVEDSQRKVNFATGEYMYRPVDERVNLQWQIASSCLWNQLHDTFHKSQIEPSFSPFFSHANSAFPYHCSRRSSFFLHCFTKLIYSTNPVEKIGLSQQNQDLLMKTFIRHRWQTRVQDNNSNKMPKIKTLQSKYNDYFSLKTNKVNSRDAMQNTQSLST